MHAETRRHFDRRPAPVIDVTRLVGRLVKGRLPTGIDRVCLTHIERYASNARAALHKGPFNMILPGRASRELFELLLRPPRNLLWRMVGVIARATMLSWPERSYAGALLLNFGHSGPEQPQYALWLRRRKLRPVFMVHDVIPVTHPEYCRPGQQLLHERRLDTVLRTATAVITNSRATLQALSKYAASRGLPMPLAAAAPLAGAVLSPESDRRPVSQPYFVMLGTIEPRKNHWMILQVWRRLIEQHGERAPRLVIVGQRGWECEQVLDLLERCDLLRGFVREETVCSDAELVTYLRHAQALLFPSFTEGYGLPLVEALNLGVPVLASNLPVFREIAGDIPEYLDPLDALGWMKTIESFSRSDCPLRSAQLRRMANFAPPTWAKHFALLEQLLRKVD
jgi:glycosyltransferase involved in cell wall biosynthesis